MFVIAGTGMLTEETLATLLLVAAAGLDRSFRHRMELVALTL